MTVVNAASVCSIWTLIAFYRACLADVHDDQNPAFTPHRWSTNRHSVGHRGSLVAPPRRQPYVQTGQVAQTTVAMTPVPPAPMLAATGPLPSDASAYCFEAKWDGALH